MMDELQEDRGSGAADQAFSGLPLKLASEQIVDYSAAGGVVLRGRRSPAPESPHRQYRSGGYRPTVQPGIPL